MSSSPTSEMSPSYNSNSSSQLSVVVSSESYINDAIELFDIRPPLLSIVDYGAAHGLNSRRAMKMIVDALTEKRKKGEDQSIVVVHNDLATNDWTSVFDLLNDNDNCSYFGLASGRSFYEQCLPASSVSIGYSSSSLHWLSTTPCPLTRHCCSAYLDDSDPDRLAFARQSREDYERFLQHRSRELLHGGLLILSIPSWDRETVNEARFPLHIDLLYRCAQVFLDPHELLDYTIPVHVRFVDECVDEQLFERLSLRLIQSQHVVIESSLMGQLKQRSISLDEFAQRQTLIIKTWTNSTLQRALKNNEEKEKITELFWTMYEQEVKEQPDRHHTQMRATFLLLKKL